MNFKNGDRVRVKQVDEFGFLGRALHPVPRHKGRIGYVVSTYEEVNPNYGEDDKDPTICYYTVALTGNYALEFDDPKLSPGTWPELVQFVEFELEQVPERKPCGPDWVHGVLQHRHLKRVDPAAVVIHLHDSTMTPQDLGDDLIELADSYEQREVPTSGSNWVFAKIAEPVAFLRFLWDEFFDTPLNVDSDEYQKFHDMLLGMSGYYYVTAEQRLITGDEPVITALICQLPHDRNSNVERQDLSDNGDAI